MVCGEIIPNFVDDSEYDDKSRRYIVIVTRYIIILLLYIIILLIKPLGGERERERAERAQRK